MKVYTEVLEINDANLVEGAEQKRLDRVQRLGFRVLKHRVAGNVAQAAGGPLALPETQQIIAQRRAESSSTDVLAT